MITREASRGLIPTQALVLSDELHSRRLKGTLVVAFSVIALAIGVGTLVTLLVDVFSRGLPWLDWQFLTSFDSRFPSQAGILAAMVGTAATIAITVVVSLPIGIMSAIYLEEYAEDNWFSRLVEINIANLAAVPSIIYGLLGLAVFVRFFAMGRSILAGGFTLALLVLPMIIVVSREAIRSVPSSIRQAAYGVGATKWQTIWHQVLPVALPSILTGNILAASRAIGETAPLITIGALTFIPFLPKNLLDRFTVLPIVIFNWSSKPQREFHDVAAAAIIVLLFILLLVNLLAIVLRQRLRKQF
ncbi:MAG: phosphate ABC transporter permease PstA [Thermoflexales bacterium]